MLQGFARTKCPENPEKSNIVSVAKERANIDKSSIADLPERGGDFLALRGGKEPIRLERLPGFDRGHQMPVNGALHEPADASDLID